MMATLTIWKWRRQCMEKLGIPGAFYITVGYIETENLPWAVRVRHLLRPRKRGGGLLRTIRFFRSEPDARGRAFAESCQHLSALTGAAQDAEVAKIEQQLGVPSFTQPELMLNWEQVRELAKRGHVVGSHTVSHPNLAHVKDDTDLRHELAESKRQLDTQLGSPVRHFSYPGPALKPHWTSRTVEVSREAGTPRRSR